MRIVIAAVGKLKDGPDRALYERYATRFAGEGRKLGLTGPELIELAESRAQTEELRRRDEAQRLLKAAGFGGSGAVLIALDARGKALDSASFARRIARERDDGAGTLVLAIGGPDGHGAEVLAAAKLTLSLGAMTLPHGLARIVLAEQLYRAATILSGHPYHRA